MGGFKKVVSLLLGLFLIALPFFDNTHEVVSIACMMEYDKGGAPAVFNSLECPHWNPSTESLQNSTTGNCQFATLQGRRKYQEDRIACDLNMRIPFLAKNGTKEVRIGIAAVFDGHLGKEASEMASNLLLDYFSLHTAFITRRRSFEGVLPDLSDDSAKLAILKEALFRTILDIDLSFSQKAFNKNLIAGSTATVVLFVDGQILVANVGDSKALLCSERFLSHQDAEGNTVSYLSAEELTRDHQPGRDDERARIEAAGGFVLEWPVPLLNGLLPMSRAIGDVRLKRYGLISVPEMTDWRPLTANDSYLVVSSDGIFESLTSQDTCDLISRAHHYQNENLQQSSSCLSSSLAECIVNTAYERGSPDNLSVVVVQLS